MTGDNVTTNDKVCQLVQKESGVNSKDRPWIAKQHRGRCMEHIIHLGSGAFITTLNPKWLSRPPCFGAEDIDADEDEENDWMEEWVDSEDEPAYSLSSATEIDPTVEFDAGDLLGKLLALINQICLSPQASDYFGALCIEEKIKPLQLIK